jgi:NTE family protein
MEETRMEDSNYQGLRLQNYCVHCSIDYGSAKKDNKKPVCDKCGAGLKTKLTGLALSGGGFRAALFHLGSLWRLNELGQLKSVGEITSVSGGSITSAYLGLRWKDLNFADNGIADNYVQEIIPPVRALCTKTIDFAPVLAGIIDPFFRPVEHVAASYGKALFGNKTLQDLPSDDKGPRFTIYATNLRTGTDVRFSKPYLADYQLGRIDYPQVPLATAVAASCAIPPILCPMIIKFNPAEWKDWETGTDSGDINPELKQKLRSALYLTDGGVYDNLGLERIWDRYATVLVSDAGAPLRFIESTLGFRFNQLTRALRASGIVTEQTRALRKRWLIKEMKSGCVRGTYWGIKTHIRDYQLEKYGCAPPLLDDNPMTRSLSLIRTRLNHFTDEEQERLINWGYALTDAAMRRHVPDKDITPGKLPYPESINK